MWKTYTFTGNLPFPEKAELVFIPTALIAPQHSDINCDKANEIREKNLFLDNQTYTLQKCPEKRRLLL